MFYSVFVLGKKGPLARVWLAAHWDKKITKAQILETNIVESVDSILQPRVKLSLRTSSHLLLGIVRIYARKTLYLLQDCQDAAFKIKSAFRPGAVDLPDGKTEAAISAITLPEMLDFINDFDLIADPPIQIDAPTTNANIRSITLVEDVSSLQMDDPLLNEVRDWCDISSIQCPDLSKNLNRGSSMDQPEKTSHPLDIYDRPPPDDGFGAPIGLGIVDDDIFSIPVPPEAHQQIEAEQQQQEAEKETERPLSRLSERSDSMSFTSAPPSVAPSGPPSTPGSVPPILDEEMPEVPVNPLEELPGNIEVPADEEAEVLPKRKSDIDPDTMVLEPLEGVGVERRRKRRKKLGIIIDEVKTLSGEEMKAQLSDTTDIVSSLDLAPPSKKLMHWKRTGGSEKLFALPEKSLPSLVLFKYYSRHLITNRIESEEEAPEENIPLMNGHHDESDETIQKNILEDINEQLPPPLSPCKEIQEPKTPRTPAAHRSPQKKRRKVDKDKDKEERAEKQKEKKQKDSERLKDKENERINSLSEKENTETSIHPFRAGSLSQPFESRQNDFINIQPADLRQSEIHNFEDEDDEGTDYQAPMSVGPAEEMMPDETAEQFEERMRNKRTNILLRFMGNQLEEDGQVLFSFLVKNNRRKQVAQKFFSLLVLKKQHAIELTQDPEIAYGEITITKGIRYDEAFAASPL